MADIKFRRGSFAGLANQPIVDGTISFTTDEGGMYVDVGQKRVKVNGHVRYYDTLANFVKNEKPPYSEDILYFIAKSEAEGYETKYNALVRWDATGGENGTGEWIQLNVTMDTFAAFKTSIAQEISAVDKLAKDNQADLVLVNQNLDTINNTIGTWTSAKTITEIIADHAQRISNLETTVGDSESGLVKDVAAVTAESAQTKKDLGDLTENHKTLSGTVSSLSGSVDELQTANTTAHNAINERIDSIVNNTIGGTAGINAQIAALQKADKDLQTDINQNKTDINGLTTSKNNHETRIGSLETTVGDASSGLVASVATLTKAVGNWTNSSSITSVISDNSKSIVDNATDINNLNTAVGSILTNKSITVNGESVTDLTSAIGKLNARDNSIDNRLTNVIDTKIPNLETSIGTVQSNLEKEAKDLKDLIDDNTTAIGQVDNKIAAQINAANAMTFRGDIELDGTTGKTIASLKQRNDLSIGDTIVVGTSFVEDDVKYHAGDLLVIYSYNNKEEGTNSTIVPSQIRFNHVNTGYGEAHAMSLQGLSDTSTKVPYIVLKDANNNNISDPIYINGSATSNITATLVDNTITIGMTWDTW